MDARQVDVEFVDESLAVGMVKRFVRDVKERRGRKRTDLSKKQLQCLIKKLKTKKMSAKKQEKHFYDLVKELSGAEPVIVIQSPSDSCGFGLLMIVYIDDEDFIRFAPVFVDYRKRETISGLSHSWSCEVVLSNNHALERFLERENVTDVAVALYVILLSWFTNYEALEEAGIGETSLITQSGGMLLGEVRERRVEGVIINEFKVSTYLDAKSVQKHNLFFCANPAEASEYTPEYWDSMRSRITEGGYILF